jgi:hypothetical protein
MKLRKIVLCIFFDAAGRRVVVILCFSKLLTASPAASILIHNSNRWITGIQTGWAPTDALIGIQIGVPIGIV